MRVRHLAFSILVHVLIFAFSIQIVTENKLTQTLQIEISEAHKTRASNVKKLGTNSGKNNNENHNNRRPVINNNYITIIISQYII